MDNKPPQQYKVVKLPPNGPKPGQSLSAWLYGKDKALEDAKRKARARQFKGA